MPHLLAQEDNNQCKNKKQTELPENRMYESPTIKELNKKHSFRWVGGAEIGSWNGGDALPGSGQASLTGDPAFTCSG